MPLEMSTAPPFLCLFWAQEIAVGMGIIAVDSTTVAMKCALHCFPESGDETITWSGEAVGVHLLLTFLTHYRPVTTGYH